MRFLCMVCLLFVSHPTLSNPLTMVHVQYTVATKHNVEGLNAIQSMKKACDESRKAFPKGVAPFKLTGNPSDAESRTETVYISPENAYYAIDTQGYKIKGSKVMCQYNVVPYQKRQIVHYAQRSAYEFDASKPTGEQWVKSEIPSAALSKGAANAMFGLFAFKMKPTGRKDRIANLVCDVDEYSMGRKNELKGTGCTWRSKPVDRLSFLGHPLELLLSNKSNTTDDVTTEHRLADSVNLKAAYDASVFAVPKDVINRPFYADELSYDQSENDDEYCLAEKKKTGVNPCLSQAAAMKWCAITKKNTGQDPCENIAGEEGDDE